MIDATFHRPFPEQLAFFRRKLNLPTAAWDDIWQEAHDRAFVVAGAMKADLVADLRAAVDRAISDGATLEDFRRDFRATVARHGWTGWTGEGTQGGEAWRTRVIYQTNLATSYAAGRWRQLTHPALLAARPFWRYVHNDSVLHPRPHHQAWGDMRLTLRHDHPFWRTHFPPNGWGCRCRVQAVTGPKAGDATEPPAGWAEPDAKTGAPPGIDRGWAYAPGASAARPLLELVDAKLLRLEAPIGAALWQALAPALAMERELAWAETLDTWLADEFAGGRQFVAGALSPRVLQRLDALGQPRPASAEIAIRDELPRGAKQRRHEAEGNALTQADWRALPALLRAPGAIYRDRANGTLIFVADGIGPTKAAVRFEAKRAKDGRNLIVSAFRVDDITIAGSIEGGEWEVIEVAGKVGFEPT